MRAPGLIVILIFIGVVSSARVAASDNTFDINTPPKAHDVYFFSFGAGRTDKFSVGLGLSYIHNENIFTLRAIANDSLDLFSGDDYDYESEVSFLLGRAHRLKSLLVSYTAGIGLVSGYHGTRNSGYPGYVVIAREFGPQACLPLEANLMFRSIPVMALGVRFFGNVNSVHSYCGIQGTISFGKLWDRRAP